jgi:TolB protein
VRIVAFSLFFAFTVGLFGDSTFEVIKRVANLPSIAVENTTEDKKYEELSTKFYRILINDFMVLTHFDVKDSNQRSTMEDEKGEFINRNVNYIMKFRLSGDSDKKLSCEVKIINPAVGTIYKNRYTIANEELHPFVAHKVVSDANHHFKMPEVDWLSKYVIFSRYTRPKHSEIVIADYTLTYTKTIVKNGLNLFPKWADSKQREFYFTKYENGTPVLHKMNPWNGTTERILETQGMLACSDVSKDGKNLLLTMAPNGQPDIFLYNVDTKKREALTKYKGIDVSGHFIENNKRITFVSDRLGYPNIFAKDISVPNGSVEQLVYYGKNNNSCSSYDSYIIYSSRETDNSFSSNTFNLHLISTETNFVRRLTATGVNQFPNFSSNGESVLFVKHYKEQSSLGIIRLNYNKSFLFPLNIGKIQSIDW